MAQQVQLQKEQSICEALEARETQSKIAKQLEEAQKATQSTMGISQEYETRLAEVTTKMATLENLLVAQRQRSSRLEHELSVAQDRIGGTERRARVLELENMKMQGEIRYWNELYSQETGNTPPKDNLESSVSSSIVVNAWRGGP